MIDLIALSAAKKHADLLAMGLTSVSVDNTNKSITFTLAADGSQHTIYFDQPSDGVSIIGIEIKNGHLICLMSDGSEIDAGVLPSGGSSGSSGSNVQPDWSQNDSAAPDYIKNRPFYTGDPAKTVFVEENTIAFAEDSGFYVAEFPSTFEATVGDTYKVYWDGTAYECTCISFNNIPAIGNFSIAGAGSDTGEPFLMLVNNGEGIAICTADTSASHTISISGMVAPVVKIPAKYIDKNSSGYVVIHSKDTMTQQEAENYRTAILTEEVVFIIWNGICISEIDFEGMTDLDLRLTTQNGENYNITKNADGLFAFSDRKFSEASFPNGAETGDVPPTIYFDKEKIKIIPDLLHVGVGSTGTLFQVRPDGTKSKAFEVLRNGEAVAPALILYSSTANSTKKFKIAIDDSGIIKIVNTSDGTEVQLTQTDEHINELINNALSAIGIAEEGAY